VGTARGDKASLAVMVAFMAAGTATANLLFRVIAK
jgi:hypothetical protein